MSNDLEIEQTVNLNPVTSNQPYAMVETGKGRAQMEAMGSIAIAKRFPRDENYAYSQIIAACKRPAMAEAAEYEYARGGTTITGPSIHLAKCIASSWGNIEYGWHELERRDGHSTVEAFAWDKQSNTRSPLTVTIKHWRDTKSGGYPVKDERDIYEICANQAARRMRACILSVIPSYIVDDAVAECRKTLKGQSKEPIGDRVKKMASAFAEQGVTIEMIETLIQSKLDACSENNLARLRRVYASIRDGVGKVEGHFKPPAPDEQEKPTKPRFTKPKPPADNQIPGAEVPPKDPTPTTTNTGNHAEASGANREPSNSTGGEERTAPASGPEPDPGPDALTVEQEQLVTFVTVTCSQTFDTFRGAMAKIGWFPGCEAWSGFSDVPQSAAEKLLKAKRGLTQQMEAFAASNK